MGALNAVYGHLFFMTWGWPGLGFLAHPCHKVPSTSKASVAMPRDEEKEGVF